MAIDSAAADDATSDLSFSSLVLEDLPAFPFPKQKWDGNTWVAEKTHALIIASTEMIHLKAVGPESAEHAVHKALLCFYSDYYGAALNGQFAEANQTSFTVQCSDNTLKRFVAWLYTGSLGGTNGSWDDSRKDSGSFRFTDTFLPVYVLADQIEVLALRREVLLHLARAVDSGGRTRLPFGFKSLCFTLAHLPSSSPMRRWLVDTCVNHWQVGEDQELVVDGHLHDLPPDFLAEVMTGLARDRSGCLEWARSYDDHPSLIDALLECRCCCCVCQYHEHESVEEREATCFQHTTLPHSPYGWLRDDRHWTDQYRKGPEEDAANDNDGTSTDEQQDGDDP